MKRSSTALIVTRRPIFDLFVWWLNYASLGCFERPERYQRPPALRLPWQMFLPQLQLDFISNPLCIWKVRLPVSSDSQRLPAFIGKLVHQKNIFEHAAFSAVRPLTAFFVNTLKSLSSPAAQLVAVFCGHF